MLLSLQSLEEGVKECRPGKQIPKRRRVVSKVCQEWCSETIIHDVLVPVEVVFGHISDDIPGIQPYQEANRKKRDQSKRCKFGLGFRRGG